MENPALCIYGEDITPNTHKLSKEFMLLDNFMFLANVQLKDINGQMPQCN